MSQAAVAALQSAKLLESLWLHNTNHTCEMARKAATTPSIHFQLDGSRRTATYLAGRIELFTFIPHCSASNVREKEFDIIDRCGLGSRHSWCWGTNISFEISKHSCSVLHWLHCRIHRRVTWKAVSWSSRKLLSTALHGIPIDNACAKCHSGTFHHTVSRMLYYLQESRSTAEGHTIPSNSRKYRCTLLACLRLKTFSQIRIWLCFWHSNQSCPKNWLFYKGLHSSCNPKMIFLFQNND